MVRQGVIGGSQGSVSGRPAGALSPRVIGQLVDVPSVGLPAGWGLLMSYRAWHD